jgi:FAD/FMN-containing dehydrogenase
MKPALVDQLKKLVNGDVATDDQTLTTHSMDKSIFAVKPKVVIFPKTGKDVCKVVRFVAKEKKKHPDLTVTARAAGTDMSGGDLNESIILSFTKYFNHTPTIYKQSASVEPGVYYRDFEKETLKHGLLYPAYPSSRELCAMGGIVNNNAGGEKSLEYGKAENYVQSMNMVLSDGNEYTIKPVNETQLKAKMKQKNFEGEVYKKLFKLINDNYDVIKKAKPDVSKNSAGYYLWNVYDKEKKTFDMTKLLVGAQGTLGVMTKADLRLVPVKKHTEMLIIYVKDLSHLAEIVNVILPFGPESLETYDDYTLELALKYVTSFNKKLGSNSAETIMKFLPEFIMQKVTGIPNLTIQAEFTADQYSEIAEKIEKLEEKLKPYNLKMKWAKNEDAEKKYWLIRRDSFALLSTRLKEKYSSPFIDDITVKPEYLPEFLPKFKAILHKYPVITAMQGHVGNGNFHVFPLLDLRNEKEREYIPHIANDVFTLVKEYHGSTSGEHNDGWVRTPYLHMQYDKKILKLFEETKKIFDPHGIFNPHKKTDPDLDFAMKHIRTMW